MSACTEYYIACNHIIHSLCRSSRSDSKPPSRNRQCWVDNVSISSYRQEFGEYTPSSAAAVAANQNVLDGLNNLQLSGRAGQNICNLKKADTYALNFNSADANAFVNLDDLQNHKLSLPDFICPSSEEKSRQAAVREWIEKSSFPWALRTIPLL